MTRVFLAAVVLCAARPSLADPCGMVPPIYSGEGIPITRVGPQRTYVFFKDGLETYVIRPGFAGKVEEFGMLIPFPSPPGLRKVPEHIFPHIAAAIDPPEIVVDLSPSHRYAEMSAGGGGAANEDGLRYDEVKVLRQEAVGMYEVAVLAAGSASALKRWMDEHGFRYPAGMDAVVNEYVAAKWVFVAEKTRVASKSKTDPRAGMRSVDPALPAGSSFDGYVQAMGFRFRVDRAVVPMRLSPFNEGEKRQIVYFLSDRPLKFEGISEKLVVRQIPGSELYRHMTELLPLRVLNGKLTSQQVEDYRDTRDPRPHNAAAKDLFASDLLALMQGVLELPFEDKEKELLRIGEALMMRGPEIDTLHEAELAVERDRVAAATLKQLQGMTLTVIDGEFPMDFMKEHDLTTEPYRMPSTRNTTVRYDAKFDGVPPASIGPGYERRSVPSRGRR